MWRKPVTILLLGFVLFALSACGGSTQGDGGGSGDGPVRVVATYSVLGDLVHNVGGGDVRLTTLVGPDGDAHTFEPAPSDNAKLSQADVVFENGLGFEPWLEDLYESSGSGAERVVATENIEPLTMAEEEHGEKGAHEEGHAEGGHEHGEVDPHVWHDPVNAIVMVESIRDALAGADPDNAEVYRRNADDYIAKIEGLDAGVQDRVDAIPERDRVLFTSHDTFGYFAERYGFRMDTALASASTETADPSAGETAALVREVEASGVPAIFAENVSNPALMQNIADEAGVELAPTLYTDALGEPGTEGGTYLGMVRYNTSVIAKALRG